MNNLAQELDKALHTLPPAKATRLTKAVHEMILTALPDSTDSEPRDANGYPIGHWERIRELWGDEPFDRPPQGVEEAREEW